MVIYEIGKDMIWTGNVQYIEAKQGAPRGWTRTALPDEIPEGKVALFTGTSWAIIDPPEPPHPTQDDVIAERERRLTQGFDFDFGDERGVHHIGTTADDMRKWLDEVTPISQALINVGDTVSTIQIFTDTGPVEVTAVEWQQILLAAGVWRQPIYQASFALMLMDPIPHDYTDDSYWP